MYGTCNKCGTENVDVNPYRDSPYFGMCWVCQDKTLQEEKEAVEANR